MLGRWTACLQPCCVQRGRCWSTRKPPLSLNANLCAWLQRNTFDTHASPSQSSDSSNWCFVETMRVIRARSASLRYVLIGSVASSSSFGSDPAFQSSLDRPIRHLESDLPSTPHMTMTGVLKRCECQEPLIAASMNVVSRFDELRNTPQLTTAPSGGSCRVVTVICATASTAPSLSLRLTLL